MVTRVFLDKLTSLNTFKNPLYEYISQTCPILFLFLIYKTFSDRVRTQILEFIPQHFNRKCKYANKQTRHTTAYTLFIIRYQLEIKQNRH